MAPLLLLCFLCIRLTIKDNIKFAMFIVFHEVIEYLCGKNDAGTNASH